MLTTTQHYFMELSWLGWGMRGNNAQYNPTRDFSARLLPTPLPTIKIRRLLSLVWFNFKILFFKLSTIFSEGKKLCKKLKIAPSKPYQIKHYKDGEFHKEYDRSETLSAFTNFLRDPTGDLPWEEDPSATNIYHLLDGEVSYNQASNTYLRFYTSQHPNGTRSHFLS